jgi:hypothetical protein
MVALTHEELAVDLARHIRARVATTSARMPVVVTEVAIDGSYGTKGRLDVVAFRAFNVYSQVALTGYEVKASRSDLLADLRAGKWKKYLPRLDRFYFAFPDGLAQRDEIPEGPGVIIRLDSGVWRIIRRSDIPTGKPDLGTLARLLYAVDRPNDPRNNYKGGPLGIL